MPSEVNNSLLKEKIIKTDLLIQKYSECKTHLKQLIEKYKNLNSKYEEAELSLERLRLENDRCSYKFITLETQYKEAEQENVTIKNDMAQLEERYATYVADSQSTIHELTQELKMIQELKQGSTSKGEETRSKLKSLENKNKKLQLSENDYKEKFENLTKDHIKMFERYEDEKNVLLKQIEEFKLQITTQEELKSTKSVLTDTVKELDSAKITITQLNERLDLQSKQLVELKENKSLATISVQTDEIIVNGTHPDFEFNDVHDGSEIDLENVPEENRKQSQESCGDEVCGLEKIIESVGMSTQTDSVVVSTAFVQTEIPSVVTVPVQTELSYDLQMFKVDESVQTVLSNMQLDKESIATQTETMVSNIIDPQSDEESISDILTEMKMIPRLLSPIKDAPVEKITGLKPTGVCSRKLWRRKRNIWMPYSLQYSMLFNIIRKRRRKVRSQDSVLKALQILKSANINFTISNESLLPPSYYTHLNLLPTMPVTEKKKTSTQQLTCDVKFCMGNNSHMMLNEDGELLAFFGVKSETSSSSSVNKCSVAPKDGFMSQIAEMVSTKLRNDFYVVPKKRKGTTSETEDDISRFNKKTRYGENKDNLKAGAKKQESKLVEENIAPKHETDELKIITEKEVETIEEFDSGFENIGADSKDIIQKELEGTDKNYLPSDFFQDFEISDESEAAEISDVPEKKPKKKKKPMSKLKSQVLRQYKQRKKMYRNRSEDVSCNRSSKQDNKKLQDTQNHKVVAKDYKKMSKTNRNSKSNKNSTLERNIADEDGVDKLVGIEDQHKEFQINGKINKLEDCSKEKISKKPFKTKNTGVSRRKCKTKRLVSSSDSDTSDDKNNINVSCDGEKYKEEMPSFLEGIDTPASPVNEFQSFDPLDVKVIPLDPIRNEALSNLTGENERPVLEHKQKVLPRQQDRSDRRKSGKHINIVQDIVVRYPNDSCDILSKIMKDMDKDKVVSVAKEKYECDDPPTNNVPKALLLDIKEWRRKMLDIAEDIYCNRMSDFVLKKWPAVLKPNTYLTKKRLLGKAQLLIKKLLEPSHENEEIKEELVTEFKRFDVQTIIKIIMLGIQSDTGQLNSGYHPLLLLSKRQWIFLKLMIQLEEDKVENLLDEFLYSAENVLFMQCSPTNVVPVTRLYMAICKLKGDVNRVRELCCGAFYYLDNLAIPLLFTVLTSWVEVFPMQDYSKNFPIANVIVHLIHLKKALCPQDRVRGVLDLLIQYYGYPKDRENCDDFFKELTQKYLRDPSRMLNFAIKLFCKYQDVKWLQQKINEFFKPLVYRIPEENVNFKATVIVLLADVCQHLRLSLEDKYMDELEKWFSDLSEGDVPELIKHSVAYALNNLNRSKKHMTKQVIMKSSKKKKKKRLNQCIK